jgi:hypothetical protein
MKKEYGFTAIELIVTILLLLSAGTIFWLQKQDLNSQHRDIQRKTAINAIYYNLEEVVFPAANGYPLKLDEKALKAMDTALLVDPDGKKIGTYGSSYSYEPSSCEGIVCKHYTLRAHLEKETDFIKKSNH